MKLAIKNFRNAEIIFDLYLSNDGKVHPDLVLMVLINLGIAFYKVGLFDEAFSCFEHSEVKLN